VAPLTIVLGPLSGGALTLTASGGPVDWSITESPGLIGELAVTPASGRLLAGQSATVSLRVSAAAGAAPARAAPAGATLTGATGACVSCTLTVNPGEITVTVLIEVNASPSSPAPSCPPPSSPSPGTEAVAGCRRPG
jgi:hypothetical protein